MREFQELLNQETANWPKDEFLEIMSLDAFSNMNGKPNLPVMHSSLRCTRTIGIVERFFSTIDWQEIKEKTIEEDCVLSEEATLDSCED